MPLSSTPLAMMIRRARRFARRAWRAIRRNWATVALMVVTAVLLTVGLTVAVRAGLLTAPRGALSDDKFNAFLVFIASILGTAATLMGMWLTHTHNKRADLCQGLQTVTQAVGMVPTEGSVAIAQERAAAALSTMVVLGQHSVAMRVLEPMWRDGRIDDATATWLIGQVLLRNETPSATEEAATLLGSHAKSLTCAGEPGYVNWPGVYFNAWLPDLTVRTKKLVLGALGSTVISQTLSWWAESIRFPARVLAGAVRDPDRDVALTATALLGALLEGTPSVGEYVRPDVVTEVDARTKSPRSLSNAFEDLAAKLRQPAEWGPGSDGAVLAQSAPGSGSTRAVVGSPKGNDRPLAELKVWWSQGDSNP